MFCVKYVWPLLPCDLAAAVRRLLVAMNRMWLFPFTSAHLRAWGWCPCRGCIPAPPGGLERRHFCLRCGCWGGAAVDKENERILPVVPSSIPHPLLLDLLPWGGTFTYLARIRLNYLLRVFQTPCPPWLFLMSGLGGTNPLNRPDPHPRTGPHLR